MTMPAIVDSGRFFMENMVITVDKAEHCLLNFQKRHRILNKGAGDPTLLPMLVNIDGRWIKKTSLS